MCTPSVQCRTNPLHRRRPYIFGFFCLFFFVEGRSIRPTPRSPASGLMQDPIAHQHRGAQSGSQKNIYIFSANCYLHYHGNTSLFFPPEAKMWQLLWQRGVLQDGLQIRAPSLLVAAQPEGTSPVFSSLACFATQVVSLQKHIWTLQRDGQSVRRTSLPPSTNHTYTHL